MAEPLSSTEIQSMIDDCHKLATETGSDVLFVITRATHLHSYATPKLKPIIAEKDGKTLAVKCLWEKVKLKLEQQVATQGIPKYDSAVPIQSNDREYDPTKFIADEDARHEALKAQFIALRTKFLAKTKPGNVTGEEGILVVATLAQQLLTMASPMMNPLIATPEGQELFKTVLNEPIQSHAPVTFKEDKGQ